MTNSLLLKLMVLSKCTTISVINISKKKNIGDAYKLSFPPFEFMFRIGSGYKNNIIETGSSEFKNLKSYYICAPDFAGRLWKSLLVTDILQLQHQPKMKFKEVHILNERSNYEQSEKIEQSLPSGLVPSWEVSLRLLRPKNIISGN